MANEALLPAQVYFSIREVSALTQVPSYVIRYWESQFSALRPARRESGQRKFTQRDVDVIFRIKELLYTKRYTIAGAKQFLKHDARRPQSQLRLDLDEKTTAAQGLDSVRAARKDLEEALRLLKS